MEFGDSSSSGDNIDVDSLLAGIYGGGDNPSQSESPAASPEPSPPQAPQFKEFEFNHGGRPIKISENDPRHSQWLSQGYDYGQKMEAFNSERQNWDKSKQEWEQNWSKYREIDSFARENPDWWNKVDQSFQQQTSGAGNVPPEVKSYLDQALQPIAQDIPLMKQFLQEMQTQKMEVEQKKADTQLDEAVKSIQTKYPDLDLSAKDETGYSLEQRVINHAMQNGFPTFRAAFLDYYHDHLEQIAEARGKEAIMKDMKNRQKMGLLDSNTPTPGRTDFVPNNGTRPRSWNDSSLSSESILREFKFA